MDLIDLFWNLRQQRQIGEATVQATRASSDSQVHESALADLNRRFDHLALITQALAELLSERAKVSQADLAAKIDEIDMRDGVRDGRAAPAPRSCPKCGRAIAGHRTTCLYCGATLDAAKPFDGL